MINNDWGTFQGKADELKAPDLQHVVNNPLLFAREQELNHEFITHARWRDARSRSNASSPLWMKRSKP
jgi:hypothetical protein